MYVFKLKFGKSLWCSTKSIQLFAQWIRALLCISFLWLSWKCMLLIHLAKSLSSWRTRWRGDICYSYHLSPTTGLIHTVNDDLSLNHTSAACYLQSQHVFWSVPQLITAFTKCAASITDIPAMPPAPVTAPVYVEWLLVTGCSETSYHFYFSPTPPPSGFSCEESQNS